MRKKHSYLIGLLWQLLLLTVLIMVMFDANMWVYLLRQGKGQLTIIYSTEKVNRVLKNTKLKHDQKQKIVLIQEIKSFAEINLGLKKTANYSSYYDQKGKPILWMLTACEPFAFKEKTWQFPVLGEVSYKGFFNYNLAFNEAVPLKMQHLDVDIGKVSAWSTLGILSDPILSSMLENNEGELAELIIHELTHATLYLPNNVDFNENFASFVGRQGALKFIAQKYGQKSVQLNTYLQDIKDQDTLKSFLLRKKEMLEQCYQEFTGDLSNSEKLHLKKMAMDNIIKELYVLPIYNWKTKIRIAHKIKTSGNAYFMSFNRYDAQYDEMMVLYQKSAGDMKNFIQHIKDYGTPQ